MIKRKSHQINYSINLFMSRGITQSMNKDQNNSTIQQKINKINLSQMMMNNKPNK